MAKHHALKTLSAAVLAMGAHQAVAAPILQYNGGYLTGATGVQVGSTLYDVAFAAGSCSDVFGADCVAYTNTATHTFTFTSQSAAATADQALVNEFGTAALSGPIVNGIVDTIATPFEIIHQDNVVSSNINLVTHLKTGYWLQGNDFNDPNVAFAVWTAKSTDVPEPASAPILLIGATALAVARRRRRL